MKKKVLRIGMMTGVMLALVGCGKGNVTDATGINPDEYVTLGEYKGLQLTKESAEVTTAEIDEMLTQVLQGNSEPVEVTGRDIVADGDVVNIDYAGTLDGVAFDGGTAEGASLTIGAGQFIPGFEEALIGVKKGETKDLDLTFPEPYENNPDLAGKAVVFTVTVNTISENQAPELNDEFVKKITNDEYKTVAEYKEYITDYLSDQKENEVESSLLASAWKMVMETTTVADKVPDTLFDQKVQEMYASAESYAELYGKELKDFLSEAMGLTEEEFKAETEIYAKESSKESLVAMAIAKKENIEVTQEDIDEAVTEYTNLYSYETEEQFRSETNMDTFKEFLLLNDVQEFLVENAVVTDAVK